MQVQGCSSPRRGRSALRKAASSLAFAWALAVGCSEKAAEPTTEDVEKARQEHIQNAQRESGQSPPP